MNRQQQQHTAGRLARLENGLLVGLLAAIILLATGQMLSRNLFDTGWPWAEPMMRTLVLWVGLTGGMIASRENRHITIPILHDRMPASAKPVMAIAAQLFTAAVAAAITFHGLRFVLMEAENPVVAFAGISTWMTATIIPFAFAVITVRAARSAWHAWRQTRR